MQDYLEPIFTTFAAVGKTFAEANNRLSADSVGTRYNQMIIASETVAPGIYSGGDRYFRYPDPISGQLITNYDGNLIYTVYQPVLKYIVPLGRIKNLISASFVINSKRVNYSTANVNTFNIRTVDYMRRYEPEAISTFPTVGSFSNNISFQEIVIPNPAQYINGNSVRFVFSEVDQENNVQRLFLDDGEIHALDVTGFRAPYLSIVYDTYTSQEIQDGIGFSHYELSSSGLIQRPGKFGGSIYVEKSGFKLAPLVENIDSIILFPGSGHQLKSFDLCCGNRCLRFPNFLSTKTVEIEVMPGFYGTDSINCYQWNTQPVARQTNFTNVGTLPKDGGTITLNVKPGERWFHFAMYDPEERRLMPVTLAEKSGKLVIVSF